MRKFLLVATCLTALAGCSTVEGLGRDISGGARTIQGWL